MNEKLDHVRGLLLKAKSDMVSAKALIVLAEPPTDVICFHCQQAVEKFLKAWLHLHEINLPKTHNLAEIVEICKRIDQAFEQLMDVKVLTPYAVEIRYADDFYFPPVPEAREALRLAEKTEDFLRSKIDL